MAEALTHGDSNLESEQLFSSQAEYSVTIINYLGIRFPLSSSMFQDFNIYENLFESNVINGDITILDSAGFEEQIPLIGQERIEIEFQNQRMPKTKFNGSYVIYKMSERINKDRNQMYVLSFISEEFIANLKTRVSKSYKSKLSGAIISDIYNLYLANNVENPKTLFTDKRGDVDGSFFNQHFVFPTLRPFEAINMVVKRSVASNVQLRAEQKIANFGSFIFFENKYGFWFKTIADLISPLKTSEGAEFKKSFVESIQEQGADFNQQSEADRSEIRVEGVETPPIAVAENIPVATYVIYPQNSAGYTPSSSEATVHSYKISSSFDVISSIAGGLFSSKLLTYDPITQMIGSNSYDKPTVTNKENNTKIMKSGKKVNYYEYNYRDEYNNFRHVGDKYNPIVNNKHYGLNHPDSVYKYSSTNFKHNEISNISLMQNVLTSNDPRHASFDKNIERWLLPMLAQKRMMKNIVIDIRISGDHNRTIGEVVEIKIPSYAFNGEEHKYLRGKYLISKIRHNVRQDGIFTTEMELVKDSLFDALEDVTEEDTTDFISPNRSGSLDINPITGTNDNYFDF